MKAPGVLLVSEPGIDGVFRHVEGLCHYLISQGCVPNLAYSSRRGSEGLRRLVNRLEEAGGRTMDLHIGNSPAPDDFRAALRLLAFAREVRPQVIHAHSSKAGALVRLAAPFLPTKRLIYTAHAYYGMGKSRSLKTALFNRIEQMLGNVGVTINISKDEASFANRVLGVRSERQRIHHNPVDSDFFRPPLPGERLAARTHLGIEEDLVVLGTVGRFVPQKDPETLYRAVSPALRANSRLRLLHIGWGELEGRVEQLKQDLGIAKQVLRGPYLEDTRILYHAIDGLVMSSTYEAGWPIVILEAMASGLPVMTTRAPGLTDIDKAGLTHCWSADVGDVDGMTEAVLSWMNDLSSNRISNHRSLVCQRFSPEKCFGGVWREYLGEGEAS